MSREAVPVVGEPRPGELLAAGPGYRWLAYQIGCEMAAAVYVDGRLLRRDARGWWVASFTGRREAVDDVVVAAIVGSAPDCPVLAEQAPLVGVSALGAA